MIKTFREKFRKRYQVLEEQKNKGKGVIGWVCTYVPEEIIEAAGLHPIRILGGEGPSIKADAYLYTNNCSFVRSCLEEALTHNLPSLDGFIACNTCDQVRRLYDVWVKYVQTPFHRILCLPCNFNPSAEDYFYRELIRLKEDIEDYFGREITQEDLWGAIRLYNQMRLLLREIYELRKQEQPPISASEVLEVVKAGMILPKEEYVGMLEELLEWLEERELSKEQDSGPRLMILGSELDDVEYLRVIEEMGGRVVVDDICCGSRYFWDLVEEEETDDPLKALARRYLNRAPCPRMHPYQKRIQHLEELAKASRVEAIISEAIKFCDPHACVTPIITGHFKKLGLPVLHLEREYAMTGVGQLKTRLGAFFEQLGYY